VFIVLRSHSGVSVSGASAERQRSVSGASAERRRLRHPDRHRRILLTVSNVAPRHVGWDTGLVGVGSVQPSSASSFPRFACCLRVSASVNSSMWASSYEPTPGE